MEGLRAGTKVGCGVFGASREGIPATLVCPYPRFLPLVCRLPYRRSAMALVALRLADRGALANEVVARQIINLAKAGERDPERLCEAMMKEFRAPPQV